YFHLMPYVMDHDEPSSWVTLSNRYYDPKVGQQLYNQYLDQLEYAEKLGWDGLCVNEHHQNCYGTMPSPNVMAAMLARRTSRAKLAILGNGLPLRENPLRIAEEIAMLDRVPGGRGISRRSSGTARSTASTARPASGTATRRAVTSSPSTSRSPSPRPTRRRASWRRSTSCGCSTSGSACTRPSGARPGT